MKKILLALLPVLLCSQPALAEKIEYYQDPVYQRLNPGDPHPMNDLIGLAEEDDVRAQFILGDLYAKGKGGLSKNEKKASYWFQQSAKRGYYPSFIRLAALAKRRNDPIEAYKWYTLAIEHFSGGKDQKYAIKARNDLAADAKLTQDQIREARKAADNWKVMKVKEDREKPAPKKVEKNNKKEPAKQDNPAKKEIKVNE